MPPSHFPPPSPPTITSVPSRVSARRRCDERAVPCDVEDDVVAVTTVDEVLARVVDDAVGADRSHQFRFRCAGNPSHLGAERLGQLDGERPHASPRADDQDSLTGSNLPLVANGLEGGVARDGDGRCLLEGEVRRLGREPVRAGAGVLGEGAVAGAEHLVPRLKLGHVLADRLDASGDIETANGVLGRAEPEARDPDQVRQPCHQVPDALVDPGRVHPDKHLVVADHRPVDLPELQDVGRAVSVLDDCLHVCVGDAGLRDLRGPISPRLSPP